MNACIHIYMCVYTHIYIYIYIYIYMDFPRGSVGKESACNAGDPGSILGLRRSSREGNGYPLQYFCLENSVDRGDWRYSPWSLKSQT